MSIKISTIVPVYNAQDYIQQCCNTILNQSLKDIEIIFVDDGSTDNSVSILNDIAKNDNRIKIIQQENQGAGIARNTGINHATGKYLHFLDADDFLENSAYEKIYNLAISLNADMVKAKSYSVDDVTNEYKSNDRYQLTKVKLKDFNKITSLSECEEMLTISVVPWNAIYKREFITSKNIYFNDLVCVNDRSFFNNVIVNSNKIAFTKLYMVHHRVNVATSLVSRRAKHFECHFKSFHIIKEQSKNLDSELLGLVLNNELSDILSWYKKFCNIDNLGNNITIDTKDFLLELDNSLFAELMLPHQLNNYFKLFEFISTKDIVQQNNTFEFNDYPNSAKIEIVLLQSQVKKYKQRLYSNNNIFHLISVTFRHLLDNGFVSTFNKIIEKILKK